MGIDAVVLVFGFWFLPALFHICPHPEILWLPPIWCVMPIVHNQILKDFQSSLLAMIFMLSQVRFERKGKYMHAQYCPALSGPMDCSPLGSSVHGIFQARILAWVAISYSRGSSQPRGRTRFSLVSLGVFFTTGPTSEITCLLCHLTEEIFLNKCFFWPETNTYSLPNSRNILRRNKSPNPTLQI